MLLLHSKSINNFGQPASYGQRPLTIFSIYFKYNRFISVELLFNVVWGALSLLLGYVWLSGLRTTGDDSPLPGRRTQFIALGMLILVLLPVVSLTDDLQAMTAPIEIEHITRRADILPASDQPADIAALLQARLYLSRYLPHLQTFALLEPSVQGARPETGCIRQLANRPPPVWA